MVRQNKLVSSEVDSTTPGESQRVEGSVVHRSTRKSARLIASNFSPVGNGVGKECM